MESKSLDYIEPRSKRLSPPAKSLNKPGPQVRRILNILKKVHGKFSKSLNGISTEFCQVPLLLYGLETKGQTFQFNVQIFSLMYLQIWKSIFSFDFQIIVVGKISSINNLNVI